MENIEKNLAHISKVISRAAIKSGRSASDIQIIGVTKYVGVDEIRSLINAGITVVGENRVQDFLPKYEALLTPPSPTWHFIGHLQRNKVKYIVDKVTMIHSLDSMALAEEINKRAMSINQVMDVLIEINIANEDSKHGVNQAEAIKLAKELISLSNIRLQGLMCIAPFVENPEDNRVHFENMRNLFLDIKAWHPHNLRHISCGMSGDYAVAIEEGATMVRIGTALYV